MRVAGYIRISRGNYSDNIISLETEMKEYISANSEWTLVDIYYDEGVSNKIKDRVGFKKMMDAVKANEIDIIVSRNINRLVRTAEIVELITFLNEHNVKLYLTEYGDYISERALTSLAISSKSIFEISSTNLVISSIDNITNSPSLKNTLSFTLSGNTTLYFSISIPFKIS